MHGPRVGRPCEEFLDRRQCFAVAQIPRGQQQARQAGLDWGDVFARSRSLGIPSTGAARAMPGVFEIRGHSAAARKSALVSPGPS